MNARAKPSGSISATPTVLSARRFQAISPRRTAIRVWQPIQSKRTSTALQARASACGTRAAWDYVGKGMAGGLIAIRPPVGSAFRSHEASIIGNTCLYGATGGRLYAAGRAGERFGVRNSGAITVVEGIGDNGCEYMTGGIVCILGKTGVNFGAGMTGGFAYVLDESGDFRKRVNPELVEVLSVDDLAIHEEHLRGLITEHVQHTGSQRGEEILANWSTFATKFALVKPKSSDVKALLGHRSRSAAELRVQAQ